MAEEPQHSCPSTCMAGSVQNTAAEPQGGPGTQEGALLQSNPLNFIEGETETQKGEAPWPRSHRQQTRSRCVPTLGGFLLELHLPPSATSLLPSLRGWSQNLPQFLEISPGVSSFPCMSAVWCGGEELQDRATLMGEGLSLLLRCCVTELRVPAG